MPEIYRTANVQEAVEMAEKFKDERRYDWFRGQNRDWPPHSSLSRSRKDPERRERTEARYSMFFRWLDECAELKAFTDFDQEQNVHSVFAILQHHGIPTHYIDFTTEPGVAGFFAADPPQQDVGVSSCIYCLNTKDLFEVWEDMRQLDERQGAKLELVTIDVRNLWRLQAQKGVFLFCNYNWDVDYPMDRILFPPSGYPSYPTRDLIYPADKSPLELVLDRYFDVEAKTFGGRELRKIFDNLNALGRNATWHNIESPPGFYESAAIKSGTLEPLPSWSTERVAPWLAFKSERLEDVGSAPVRLRIDPSNDARAMGKSIAYGVGRLLRSDNGIRKKTISWQLQGFKDNSEAEGLATIVGTIWNGMRWLPFSVEDIAEACGVATTLFALGLSKQKSAEENRTIAATLLGECIGVEFGATDFSSSRGYVANKSLLEAVRPDMGDLLVEKYASQRNDPRTLLRIVYSPSRLFDFDKFARLFAREVIPTQVLTRDFKLFSPAQMLTFGLP